MLMYGNNIVVTTENNSTIENNSTFVSKTHHFFPMDF